MPARSVACGPDASGLAQAERRDVKWRLHWLELRLRELAYQRARHEEAYAQLCGATTDAEATAEAGSQLEATFANQTPSLAGAAYSWSPLCVLSVAGRHVSFHRHGTPVHCERSEHVCLI